MRYVTPQLLGFGATTLVLSIGFFFYLYSSLETREYSYIWVAAISYGLLMFLNGFVWGWFDSVRKSQHDLGFMYHLYTFAIVNLVNLVLMSIFGYTEQYLRYFLLFHILCWGFGLSMHYFGSRKRIKGMNKEDLFV
jgi:hypothetical protein